MAKVSLSTTLPVPARTVWDANSLAKWHPAVARSEESKEGTATVRRLTLHGGGTIVEQLDGKNDRKRTYTYSILEGPLPVAGYTAKLHVEENKDGRGCTGFDSLRKMFGQ